MAVYLDIFIGDRDEHAKALARYESTCTLLSKNSAVYGLPSTPSELSEEQQQILNELDKSPGPLLFAPPIPLLAGRLVFTLNDSPALAKTMANFSALCTGERGMCKSAPTKRLHYSNTPLHRIVKGFIAQGGDVTRGDGSGGESIFGRKFNDEKEGLKAAASKGCLAMANSGKNSNTSQFFIVLTDDENKLAKLSGKYVVFGQLTEGWDVLAKLDEIGGGDVDGKPTSTVWVGDCGKC